MPNRHKLGAYMAPPHNPEQWNKYLFDLDPPWVRLLMPGDSPTSLVSNIYQMCPHANISLRWWDVDDGGTPNKNGKLADPERSATNDVAEYVRRVQVMEYEAKRDGLPFPQRSQLYFNALNEPPSWLHEHRPAIARYSIYGIQEARKAGFNFMALELAVGHPEEWPPVWDWAKDLFVYMSQAGGVLALHEYWQPEGPMYVWKDNEGRERKDWGALAGRYQHLRTNVPIVISECGVDGRIFERHATPDTGYLKFMDAYKYAAQMNTYLEEVGKDKRIRAVLPFITDFADKEWASFDTLHAKDAFVAMLDEMEYMEKPVEEDSPGTTVFLPSVHSGDEGGGEPARLEPEPADDVPLTVDPFVARAILQVESGNAGFNGDGSLVIRFEAHIFERYVGKFLFGTYFRYDPNDILSAWYKGEGESEWKPIHRSQTDEYAAFRLAQTLPTGTFEAAYLSISMGAAQIMGFNHARVGFASPKLMYYAFSNSLNYQLIAFWNYLHSDPKLMRAISARDWRTIATLYNGSQFVEVYSARLSNAYQQARRELDV